MSTFPNSTFFPSLSHHSNIEDFFIGNRDYKEFVIRKEFVEDADYSTRLFYTNIHSKKDTLLASLLILHDYSDHSSRYFQNALNFAEARFNVHLFDFRGFGYSSGVRMMTSLEHLQEDLITMMFNLPKGLPLYVLCNSMGGSVLLTLLLSNPEIQISGIILINPWIDFPVEHKKNWIGKYIIRKLPSFLDVS